MSWFHILLVYLIGFGVIIAFTLVSLRSEPTAHGQIVGTQVGCMVAVFWPIMLAWTLVVGIACGAAWVWGKVRAR